MHKILTFSASLLCASTGALFAQAMSNDKTANPTTQGYATSGAALKDQHSTGPKPATRHSRTAKVGVPTGTTPAETAGASSPNPPVTTAGTDASKQKH